MNYLALNASQSPPTPSGVIVSTPRSLSPALCSRPSKPDHVLCSSTNPLDLKDFLLVCADHTPWSQFMRFWAQLDTPGVTTSFYPLENLGRPDLSNIGDHVYPNNHSLVISTKVQDMMQDIQWLPYLDLGSELCPKVIDPKPYLPPSQNFYSNVNPEGLSDISLRGGLELVKYVGLVSNNIDVWYYSQIIVELTKERQNLEFFKRLLDQNLVSINAVAEELLFSAVKYGNWALIDALLDHRVDLSQSAYGERGPQLLQYAIETCNETIVLGLLNRRVEMVSQYGFDQWDQWLRLETAVKNSTCTVVKHVIRLKPGPHAGCNVFQVRENIFVIAARRGDVDVFKTLISESPCTFEMAKQRPWLLFEAAALGGSLAMLDMLQELGLDINAVDNTLGGSPLAYAISREDYLLTQYLLDAGASINNYISAGGIVRDIICKTAIFENLLVDAASTNPPFRMAAIHIACFGKNVDLICYLLSQGANPNQPGGLYPIQFAAGHGCADMVRMLLENGADPNLTLPCKWKTPFLNPNEDARAEYDSRMSAIQIALKRGNPMIVGVLLENNAKFPTPRPCVGVHNENDFHGHLLAPKLRKKQNSDGDPMDNEASHLGELRRNNWVREATEYDTSENYVCECDPEEIWNPLLNAIKGRDRRVFSDILNTMPMHRDLWITPQCLKNLLECFDWNFCAQYINNGIFPLDLCYQQEILIGFIKRDAEDFVEHIINSQRLELSDINTAFAEAAIHGKEGMVRLFLKSGYWPDESPRAVHYQWELGKDPRYHSALEAAFLGKKRLITDIILQHYEGLLDKAKEPTIKRHFLQAYAIAIKCGEICAAQMLGSQLGVNEVDHRVTRLREGYRHVCRIRFYSFVQLAVGFGRYGVAQWLLDRDANLNNIAGDSDGWFSYHSPLQIAVRDGEVQVVKKLLKKGAHVDAMPITYNGATALQFAAISSRFDIFDLLIEAGANINALPGTFKITSLLIEARVEVYAFLGAFEGRSAIEGAAEWGRLDMVSYLLEAGADIRGKFNRNYRRTVYRAWRHKNYALTHMIQRWKAEKYGPSDCDSINNILETMQQEELICGEGHETKQMKRNNIRFCGDCVPYEWRYYFFNRQ